MKVKVTLSAILVGLVGCASLTPQGEKVTLIQVSRNQVDLDKKESSLKNRQCKLIGPVVGKNPAGGIHNIKAGTAIALKNETASAGGNVVITSGEIQDESLKGRAWKCPQDLTPSDI